MWITELIEAIRSGGEETQEAALALGLLIEREKAHRPAGDDGGIRVILGDEWVNRRMAETELQTAVDELIKYIHETVEPHPTAVWALTKSYDPRIVPYLIKLLDQVQDDPEKEHLAYQALIGIINTGVSSSHKDISLAAIEKAGRLSHGQVKETAIRYLEFQKEM